MRTLELIAALVDIRQWAEPQAHAECDEDMGKHRPLSL
jgi:hypothetical protein